MEVKSQVKWFNAKAGFGFTTVLEGELKGKEVFVHHSNLRVEKEQFRYLVEGEYVQLEVSESTKGEHKYQGTNVRGILGGRLMCEIRQESTVRPNTRETTNPREKTFTPREKTFTPRESGPRESAPRETKPRESAHREKKEYKKKVEVELK